ncbi:hypothetical protein KAH94_01000, partial [bacterium]|nr:hypothetical protein [bacterium]
IIYVQKEYNYFQKTLIITVYDNKQKNETRKLIWQGSSMSCCDNDDLRSDTDFLLISVFKYFGQDTKKRKSLTLSENNKDVAALRDDTKKLFRSKKRSRKKKTVV